eukprot:m51a1_g7352 hypothetical protein (91) ;mRNA; r:24528-25086
MTDLADELDDKQNAKWVNVSNCELRLNLPRKNVLLPLSPAMELKDAFFSLVSPEVVTYIASSPLCQQGWSRRSFGSQFTPLHMALGVQAL